MSATDESRSTRGTEEPGATRPKQDDKSLGDLFGDMTAELGELFRQEVELAKVETREQVARAGKSAGMFGGAGIGGWMAALFLSLALGWLLDQAMNRALAFAIVGAAWAVVAVVLLLVAKRELAAVEPLPTTTQTLKEDVQWAKAQRT